MLEETFQGPLRSSPWEEPNKKINKGPQEAHLGRSLQKDINKLLSFSTYPF